MVKDQMEKINNTTRKGKYKKRMKNVILALNKNACGIFTMHKIIIYFFINYCGL